jgi:hypothetical protein
MNGALASVPWQARIGICAAVLAIFAGIAAAAFVWGSGETQSIIIGAAIVMAKEGTGYFFSSSASSDKKDDTLAANAAALAASTPAPAATAPPASHS